MDPKPPGKMQAAAFVDMLPDFTETPVKRNALGWNF
jgi:hypothetical protein